MKDILMNYIPSLGSFLDEKGIDWTEVEAGIIAFKYENAEQLFRLGREFAEFEQSLID